MQNIHTVTFIPENLNKSVLIFYLALLGIFLIAGLGYLLWNGKFMYLALIAAIPLALLIISNPKLAVGQYILFLFYSRWILDSPLLFADVSGFLLISAASLDLFSDSRIPQRLPRLSINFLAILSVIAFAGLFSYLTEAAIRPFGRVTLLFLHFLAMYRLSGKVSLSWSLNLFYWLAVIHSIFVVIPFLISKGTIRSFGFAPVEMAMLALVIATAKFLWARKGEAWIYLSGMFIILFALLSTQYRSLIIGGIVMSAIVAFVSRRRAKNELRELSGTVENTNFKEFRSVKNRPLYLLSGLILSVLLVFMVYPQLLDPLIERFEGLVAARLPGSVIMRMTLWKHAWSQFVENPLTGMGPGLFIHIQNIIPTIRMDFYYKFVHGLSAHNLLLHYLAEAGIFGGIAVIAIMFNQMRLSVMTWLVSSDINKLRVSAMLFGIAFTILTTTMTESSWLWGQSSLVFAFFVSLISRNYTELVDSQKAES